MLGKERPKEVVEHAQKHKLQCPANNLIVEHGHASLLRAIVVAPGPCSEKECECFLRGHFGPVPQRKSPEVSNQPTEDKTYKGRIECLLADLPTSLPGQSPMQHRGRSLRQVGGSNQT